MKFKTTSSKQSEVGIIVQLIYFHWFLVAENPAVWNRKAITLPLHLKYICFKFVLCDKKKFKPIDSVFDLYPDLSFEYPLAQLILLGCVLTIVPLISVKEDDNTLTVIIVSVLGGVIGLVVIVMVIKAVVVHFLRKGNEKKWVTTRTHMHASTSLMHRWMIRTVGPGHKHLTLFANISHRLHVLSFVRVRVWPHQCGRTHNHMQSLISASNTT